MNRETRLEGSDRLDGPGAEDRDPDLDGVVSLVPGRDDAASASGVVPVQPASWGAFVAVGAVVAVGQCSPMLVTAALSLYLHALGAATDRVGVEISTASVVAMVCTLSVGPLINRWGAKRLLLAGTGAYLIAALGLLALPTEPAVVAFRALQGVGAALILPSSLTLAPRLVPLKPGTAIGVIGTLYTLSIAVGPPTGLWLYAHGGPVALFLPAAACAAAGMGLSALLPASRRAPATRQGLGFDSRWTPQLVAGALGNAYFGAIVAYLPLVLAYPGAPNAGIFFTADALGVLAFRLPSGMLVDRSGPRPAEFVGIILTLAGLGALFVPASPLTLIAAGVGTGVGAGLFGSAVLVALTNLSDEHNRGTAMALSSAGFNVGTFVGGSLAGVMMAISGFDAVLAFGLITTGLALPLVLPVRRKRPLESGGPAKE